MDTTAEEVRTTDTHDRQDSRLLEVDPKRFGALSDMRKGVNEALVRFNVANEDAKAKKKIYEAARTAFEREFDRFVANVNGEDLPLFSQRDVLDRAHADPVVMKLVDRLLSAGHDVNAIIVAGYSQDERAQAEKYLDQLDADAAAVASGEGGTFDVEVPAFLLPQPLTPIEIADLGKRLAEVELTITVEQLAHYGKAQVAEIRDFLDRVDAIAKEKGEALTADDLPEPPAFLVEADAANVESDGGEEDTDEDTNDDAPKVH
jgi:hypothetical protein